MRSWRGSRLRRPERPVGRAVGRLIGPPAGVAAFLFPLAFVAGCASGGGGSAGGATEETAPGTGAVVIVENTESPGSSVSVELVSSTGDRTLLGAVGPRRTESFEVGNLRPGVSYRLVAGITGGGDVVSERFTLSPGSRVRWTLPLNMLSQSP